MTSVLSVSLQPQASSGMNELKLCKDCKHFLPATLASTNPYYATCKKLTLKTDLVHGHKYYVTCEEARYDTNPCGISARQWEALDD